MLFKTILAATCLAAVASAQVGSIFCQARYITNVATCVIGVTECNAVERFSSCVCANTQNKAMLRQCLIALLYSPEFSNTLTAGDFKAITAAAADTPADATPEATAGEKKQEL